LPYRDPETKRKKDKERYGRPQEKEKRRKRYEERKLELAKKREEERQLKLEAFCRHYDIDVYCLMRLIAIKKAGRDIEYDKKYARYVRIWESGKWEPVKDGWGKSREGDSVQSLDYY